jgi:hypothetical protein
MSKLIFIKNFPNRAFAEQASEILKKESISCVLTSPDVGILGTSTSSLSIGVDLYVDEQDEQRTRLLLEALFNGI